jgi:hypothetical protein
MNVHSSIASLVVCLEKVEPCDISLRACNQSYSYIGTEILVTDFVMYLHYIQLPVSAYFGKTCLPFGL